MTRKDYVRLAEALRCVRGAPDSAARAQWLRDREVIANVLAADNPRFNRATFERATEE